jgi:hypothetical protein
LYYLIEEGAIVSGPQQLPNNWRNISGLNNLDDSELLALGWYPYVETWEDLPGEYYYHEDGDLVIEEDSVTRYVAAMQYTVDQVTSIKQSEIYTIRTSQDIQGEEFEGKKVDVAEWAEEKAIELDALTEREDVEAFDTALVILPDDRVAAVMMRQAEAFLTAEAYRETVGAAVRLSPATLAIVHDWMLPNYTAIDTGSAPVTPPEQLRQHVRIPGEMRERFSLRRREWDGKHGFVAYVEGESVDGLAVKVFNAAGAELFDLTFAEDEPGRWICGTGPGQRSDTEIEFGFQVTWNYTAVHNKVVMTVGKDTHSLRGLRWGGV